MKIFVGMETSGEMRRRLVALGHDVISCDTLPADDGAVLGQHIQGDVFDTLKSLLMRRGWVPDFGIFHPTCTLHTVAAAWAFSDPDYDRYPGVGYHQKVTPETLVGADRHKARDAAEADAERIKAMRFPKIVENPRGTLPTRTSYGRPADVLQPYEFGDDASKATCIWAFDERGQPMEFVILRDPALYVPPTLRPNGKSYWGNQTDTGQNKLSPGDDRWKDRSKTFPGIADAVTGHIHGLTWRRAAAAYGLV